MSSCTNESVEPKSAHLIENYSPKQVFKAIFFLKGDLVNEIPTLMNLKVQSELFGETAIYVANNAEKKNIVQLELHESHIDETIDFIANEIDQMNPNILPQLKLSIKSGNPEKISSKIKETALLLKVALFQVPGFTEGISLIQDAYLEAGIYPQNYNFSNKLDVERYLKDMKMFMENSPNKSYNATNGKVEGIAVVVMVVAVVYLAVAFLAAVAVAGEVAVTYFNVLWIHNWAWIAEGSEEPEEKSMLRSRTSLKMNQLIAELIYFDNDN